MDHLLKFFSDEAEMITRYDGHGSFAKQYLKEGSLGGTMKVSPLHSYGQHTYSSGENLSPRSVLEQRALSGLAIAIDLKEKTKLSYAQENAIAGTFLSKQIISHKSTQETAPIEGKSVSRESLHHVNHDERATSGDERETLSGGSTGLGTKVHHVRSTQDAHEGRSICRSGPRERVSVERREVSNVGPRAVASRGGDEKEDKLPSLEMAVNSTGGDMAMDTRRTACGRQQNTFQLNEVGHSQQTCPPCRSVNEDCIFYRARNLPSTDRFHEAEAAAAAAAAAAGYGYPTSSSVEGFLKCCFLCKCRLRAGKDIYMYRGDQAFCSVECRSEQIVKDERVGASGT